MALLKAIQTPFGAAVSHHEIARVEGNPASQHLTAIVHSWPSVQACTDHGGNGATFVWPVPFPVEAMLTGSGGFLAKCEAAVIAFEDPANPFFGAATCQSVTDIDTAKRAKWANIKQTRDILDNEPIQFGGFQIDADAKSRTDIMGAVMTMQISGPSSRSWRCTDNVMRTLTLDNLVAVGTAIATRRQGLIERSDALYSLIQSAQTVQAVNAISWLTEV
jgi:hypothetical protein